MLFSSLIGWNNLKLISDWLKHCDTHLWLVERLWYSSLIGCSGVPGFCDQSAGVKSGTVFQASEKWCGVQEWLPRQEWLPVWCLWEDGQDGGNAQASGQTDWGGATPGAGKYWSLIGWKKLYWSLIGWNKIILISDWLFRCMVLCSTMTTLSTSSSWLPGKYFILASYWLTQDYTYLWLVVQHLPQRGNCPQHSQDQHLLHLAALVLAGLHGAGHAPLPPHVHVVSQWRGALTTAGQDSGSDVSVRLCSQRQHSPGTGHCQET